MVRGIITFKCSECKHYFRGPDLEYCATIYSTPLKCPQCGSMHTAPRDWFGLINPTYRMIWKSMDRKMKENEADSK